MSTTTLSARHEARLADFVADLETVDGWDETAVRYTSLVAVYLEAGPDADEIAFLAAATAAFRERRRRIAAGWGRSAQTAA